MSDAPPTAAASGSVIPSPIMRRPLPAVLLTCTLLACGGESTPAQPAAPAQVPPPTPTAPAPIEAPKPELVQPELAKPELAKPELARLEVIEPADPKLEDPTPEPENPATTAPPPGLADIPPAAGDAAALPAPPEIAIQPWTSLPHTPTWTLRAEPAEPIKLVDLNAGVLGQAGAQWFQLGADGQLAAFKMETEPKQPVLGVWPSDAWYVDQRFVKYGEDMDNEEYLELRLMKLRAGKRWVPQIYSGTGEAWWHPGTDDWEEAHISTLSGMLVYNGSLTTMKRVAGKHPDPDIGPHRGEVVGFLETGAGKTYLLSKDDAGHYAQTTCEDDLCVAESVRKLPLTGWTFGRKLTRGRHSVSVLATSEGREFILHNRGKPDGWWLDELPAGERPTGMWASQEGGLWTLTGDRLRWRAIKGVWLDVALPEGLGAPTVALSEDRQQVWVSGVVAGAAKVYSAPANAQAPAAPTP